MKSLVQIQNYIKDTYKQSILVVSRVPTRINRPFYMRRDDTKIQFYYNKTSRIDFNTHISENIISLYADGRVVASNQYFKEANYIIKNYLDSKYNRFRVMRRRLIAYWFHNMLKYQIEFKLKMSKAQKLEYTMAYFS